MKKAKKPLAQKDFSKSVPIRTPTINPRELAFGRGDGKKIVDPAKKPVNETPNKRGI